MRTRGADGVTPNPRLKALDTGALMSEGRGRWMSQLKKKKRKSALPPSFCSIRALDRLHDCPPTLESTDLLYSAY